jgi:hypothetical protein
MGVSVPGVTLRYRPFPSTRLRLAPADGPSANRDGLRLECADIRWSSAQFKALLVGVPLARRLEPLCKFDPRIGKSSAQKQLQGPPLPSRATYSVDYGIGDIIEMRSCYLAASANASPGTADVRYHTQNSRLTRGSPILSQTALPVIASDARKHGSQSSGLSSGS